MSGVLEADSESVIGGLGDGLPVRARQFFLHLEMKLSHLRQELNLKQIRLIIGFERFSSK